MKKELCAASVEAVCIAKELNFDRIELCQNLEQGGMTPSPGFIEYALALGLETHVLIRPRSGGFYYTKDEVEIMVRDIHECKEIGAHGVVVGVLDEQGLIDKNVMELLIRKAEGMDVTFHRAFDDLYSLEYALDTLVNLGVKRVLSSGMARNIEQGMHNLLKMMEYANGRIEIMVGGGVNTSNLSKLIDTVHPDAVHFSGTTKERLDENSMFSEIVLKPNRDKIEHLLACFKD